MRVRIADLPTPALLVTAGIFGGISAFFFVLAATENEAMLTMPGVAFASMSGSLLFFVFLRAVRQTMRTGVSLAKAIQQSTGRTRAALIGGAVIFGLLVTLGVHNGIAWVGIDRACRTAEESSDTEEARRALKRGTEAMQNPLLLLPNDLFDVWAPRRCRDARARTDLIPPAVVGLVSGLGPVMGEPIAASTPESGDYIGAYQFEQNKLHDRETSYWTKIEARARMQLGGDGVVTACFAAKRRGTTSISRYASHDGKDQREKRDDRLFLGARGSWKEEDGTVRVELRAFQSDSCAVAQDAPAAGGAVAMRCLWLERNSRLLDGVLACKLVEGGERLRVLAISPAEGPRAGPAALQVDPGGNQRRVEKADAWLVLGAEPGLSVTSRDGRREGTPSVTFSHHLVEFDEGDWR